MPSHPNDSDSKGEKHAWVTERDIFGNSKADDLAGEAAKEYSVGSQTASDCICYCKFSFW